MGAYPYSILLLAECPPRKKTRGCGKARLICIYICPFHKISLADMDSLVLVYFIDWMRISQFIGPYSYTPATVISRCKLFMEWLELHSRRDGEYL